jgi:UDP-3-O-[3-hydroxymyristoyl] N-acetylglucosamine deacetylase/3-hydroxyacyl-[acyl-carrier-protein] dehydratase
VAKQKTISQSISLTGVGLHTGNTSTIMFKPAEPNTHYVFVRADLPERVEIPALVDYVVDISRGTTLGIDIPGVGDDDGKQVVVHTVEHVLAALVGLGIDNCIIELSTNEPPVFDGSSRHYVDALLEAEIVEQEIDREYFELSEQVGYKNNEKLVDMVALPLNDYRLTVMVDYFIPALGSQHSGLFNMESEFVEEFSSARTFCFFTEVENLLKQGLIKGGGLESAVVIMDKEAETVELEAIQNLFKMKSVPIVDDSGILNGTKLRYKNEPARHKLLDLIGDLALVGVPIKAQILAARPGHKSNVELAKLLRKQYLRQKVKERINPQKNKKIELDIYKILEIIPHRFPFLLVDKIIHLDLKENIIVGVKNVTVNEPFFTGHFPDKPVMPGVLIAEAMGQVGGLIVWYTQDVSQKLMYFSGFKNVKFKKPVIPGDQLVFEVQLVSQKFGMLIYKGTAYVDGEVVCEAEYYAALVNK